MKFPKYFTILLISFISYSPVWAQIGFNVIGELPGGYIGSSAYDVSNDGQYVVGSSYGPEGLEAFRWDLTNGMVGLGSLNSLEYGSVAKYVSGDGSLVMGWSWTGYRESSTFSWTPTTGMVLTVHNIGARAISADGTLVAGDRYLPDYHYQSYAWDSINGEQSLGDLGTVLYVTADSWVTDISSDGQIVVGYADTGVLGQYTEAYRWDPINGMVGLGQLPGGSDHTYAWGISGDGSVIVGYELTDTGKYGWKWDTVGGYDVLGLEEMPWDASFDGSVIIGQMWKDGWEATMWIEENGYNPISLNDFLDNNGIDRQGFHLSGATGISDNGKYIVGSGYYTLGDSLSFIVMVPEPSFYAGLLGIFALVLVIIKRHQK